MRQLKFKPTRRGESSILESFSNTIERNVDVFISDEAYAEFIHNEDKQTMAMILTGFSGRHKMHSAVRALVDDRLHHIFVRKAMFKKKEYMEYLKAFQKKTGKDKVAVLYAHGDYQNGRWVFYDQAHNEPLDVQEWIVQNDDKYSCLILCCCNPGASTPMVFQSLLVLPDADLSSIDMLLDKCHLSLIDPFIGEVNEYTLASDLMSLKRNS